MEKEMILTTDDEAATFKTDISGWVDRHGRFWGKDERQARWSGATHVPCGECGKPVEKSWIKCPDCREKASIRKYLALPKKPWDEEYPLYSMAADKFFDHCYEIEDYCNENSCVPGDLDLVLCEPQYANEIDPDDYYCDLLAEDGEVEGDLRDAFDELNKVIRESKVILSYIPSGYAAEL